MSVDEMIAALQALAADGYGSCPVVLADGAGFVAVEPADDHDSVVLLTDE